jgi:hypothetical protein
MQAVRMWQVGFSVGPNISNKYNAAIGFSGLTQELLDACMDL